MKIQMRRGIATVGTQLDTGEFGHKTDTRELHIGQGVGQPSLRVALWDEFAAHSILAAVAARTPTPLTIAEQRVVGRATGGNIAALAGDQLWAILSGQAGADVSMNSRRLTAVMDPTGPHDAATKTYVDSVATGLSVKSAVRFATTGNISLSGSQEVDGAHTSPGDRVLVKNQTAPAQNGIYIAAAGAWTRATDMDAAAEVPHSFVFVIDGITQAETGWVCTNEPEGLVIGTTPISFAQFSGAGFIQDGLGLTKDGNVLAVTGPLEDIFLAGSAPAKGSLLVTTAPGVHAWLAVGANGQVLTADSAEQSGFRWAASPGGGANPSLSNLSAVAINAALVPGAAGALDFGSPTHPWRDFHFAGTSATPGTNRFRFTGASTGGVRTITFPDLSGTVLTDVSTIDGGTLS